MGHSGGSQSSGHHKRTNQGQKGSSASSGPPRPAPSATTTSGALAATSQGKRQPEEQDRSVTKKVRYLYCWSIENLRLSTCLNHHDGLSKESLHSFVYFKKGSLSKLTFHQFFLNNWNLANVYYKSPYNFFVYNILVKSSTFINNNIYTV